MLRWLSLLAVAAIVASDGDVGAEPPRTITVAVHVEGEGPPIRVQVFPTYRPSLCDLSLRPLVDAMVVVGETVSTITNTFCVCYRHTNGVLRRVDFGSPVVACWPRRLGDEPVLHIAIRAERAR
jgi:hypothetical protein